MHQPPGCFPSAAVGLVHLSRGKSRSTIFSWKGQVAAFGVLEVPQYLIGRSPYLCIHGSSLSSQIRWSFLGPDEGNDLMICFAEGCVLRGLGSLSLDSTSQRNAILPSQTRHLNQL